MFNAALTLPNLITIARLVAVPVIVYLMLADAWLIAFWLFLAAGISDAADGYIARHFNQGSELGAYLDPIADKVLLVAVFIILAINEALPLWLVIVIVARDLFIIGGVVLASVMGASIDIDPILISKATTVAQIALAGLLFAAQAFSFAPGLWGEGLIYVTAGLTLASATAYAMLWLKHMAGFEDIQ